MQKIFDKIKAMSLGKKIYATLWATWFIMLIVFVGVASGLNPRVGVKATGEYVLSTTEDYKKAFEGNPNTVTSDKAEAFTISFDGHTDVTVKSVIDTLNADQQHVDTIYRDNAMSALANDDENKSTGEKPVQMYKIVYKPGDLTADAQKATNAIAGVGMGFFITMAAAVFTTVGVEVAAKKGGKK